jgi:hypothetical protein
MVATRSKKADAAEAAEPIEIIDFSEMTLAQRLTKARELLGGGVEKKGQNTAQNYAYVKAGDVSRDVYDALARVGVYAIPSYQETGDEPIQFSSRSGTTQFMARVKTTLSVGRVEDKVGFTMAVNGPETLTVSTIGYGADSGDKGPFKAMTGGLKYALLHLLGLATDDDPEATSEAPAPASPPRTVGPRPASAQAAEAEPASAPDATPTTPVGGDPEAKITVNQQKLIFTESSKAGLTPDQFKALVKDTVGKEDSRTLVSKDVDTILAALADPTKVSRAKQEESFEKTVGSTPEPEAVAAARLLLAQVEAAAGAPVETVE